MEKETYRECMRNHAAKLGTYATDGCGEYTSNLSSPDGLQCAACGCHRNFHRKVVPVVHSTDTSDSPCLPYSPSPEHPSTSSEGRRRARTKFTAEQKEKMMLFAEKIRWRIPRGDGDIGSDEVSRFCGEIGVSRQVFKVWMHNHKNAGTSRSPPNPKTGTETNGTPAAEATGGKAVTEGSACRPFLV